jgi:hypothetical protein
MIIQALRRRLARFARGETGTAAVELVITLPTVMFLFIASAESGLYMTRLIMLDRAVDMTMRDLRLGLLDNPTSLELKQEICSHTSILPDCVDALRLELVPVSTVTWNFPTGRVGCVDRDEEIQEATAFNPGVDNELMLVRACMIQDAMFPGAQIGEGLAYDGDEAGGYALISINAFVNEPT